MVNPAGCAQATQPVYKVENDEKISSRYNSSGRDSFSTTGCLVGRHTCVLAGRTHPVLYRLEEWKVVK